MSVTKNLGIWFIRILFLLYIFFFVISDNCRHDFIFFTTPFTLSLFWSKLNCTPLVSWSHNDTTVLCFYWK
jgi:hypothetical protein